MEWDFRKRTDMADGLTKLVCATIIAARFVANEALPNGQML